jgi:putative redox protein
MSTTPATALAHIGDQPYTVNLSDGHAHHWLADEPIELGGANQGPTPMGMLLGSLGACTAITLKMYAARKGWPLQDVQVHLSLQAGDAAGGQDIQRDITLQGELDDEQRTRLLQIAHACPVHKLLTGEVRIASQLVR